LALIELDRDAPVAPPPSRPPDRYFRYATILAVVALVLTLGGAVPTVPVLWRRTGLAPLAGASTSYQLVGDTLYTLDGNANRRTTTAWSLDPLHKMWSVSTALQLDDSGTVIHDDAATLSRVGPYLLLLSGSEATVIDPATGRIRWTSKVPLLTGRGTTALVQDAQFAAGTEYDQSSGDPGSLYFSAGGVPHTSPPQRTVLRGLDLATGRQRWAHTEPGSVYAVPAGDPTDGYLVISADRIALLDGRTGAVRRTRALPRATGDIFPDVIGDVVLMASDGSVRAVSVSAFDFLWQHTESIGARADQGSCLGLLCDTGRDSITVLDPATGAARWTAPSSALLIARGPDVLEEQTDTQDPIVVRDRSTGRARVDLRAWQTVADSDPDDPILLFRAQTGTARAQFGALLPGAGRVQPLGRTSAPVSECSSDARYVACRTAGGVEVFAYRA
jgi:outer membrane protein assembly factor BamB